MQLGPHSAMPASTQIRERAAAPGADQEVVFAGEQKGQSKSAFKPRQSL